MTRALLYVDGVAQFHTNGSPMYEPREITVLHKAMTEDELQLAITDCMGLNGWEWFHDRDSKQNRAGFPDLVMVHQRRGFYVMELKKQNGTVTDAQERWLRTWAIWWAHVYVIRPCHLSDVIHLLCDQEHDLEDARVGHGIYVD